MAEEKVLNTFQCRFDPDQGYVEKPNVCRKVALRLLEEALEAAKKEEWDHAHHLAFDATIWLEGAYPDGN